jgi:acetoin utilization protein AcuB
MRSRQVRHVLVTDEQERLVGIVTDRDLRHSAFLPLLARHLAWEERWLKAPRVRDVMTWSVVTIEPDADLVRAGLLMFERRIGSLPVTEHGTLVGMVTERDVFEAFRPAGESPDPAELYLG